MTTKKIALTGIKPSGQCHIGNYLGMLKPALELTKEYQALYFIADYHALTTVQDRKTLNDLTYDVAATWLALGLDPEKTIFFRQSDIPEIFEFSWVLSCFTAKGLLNRAHAYKAAVAKNQEAGLDEDAGINSGLYYYPVLMASDILLYGSHVVPVGLDQKQHVEIARDIAQDFNHTYKTNLLVIPEPQIKEDVMVITGLDGRKMSKSYDNVIPLFAPSNKLKERVMRIVTDSRTPEEPKNPDECNIYAIYRHFAAPEELETTRQLYLNGGLAYGEMKKKLFLLLDETFKEPRERYNALIADRARLDDVLMEGARKARAIATPMMEKIRQTIGVK